MYHIKIKLEISSKKSQKHYALNDALWNGEEVAEDIKTTKDRWDKVGSLRIKRSSLQWKEYGGSKLIKPEMKEGIYNRYHRNIEITGDCDEDMLKEIGKPRGNG